MKKIGLALFLFLFAGQITFAKSDIQISVARLLKKAESSGKATVAVLPVTNLSKSSSIKPKLVFGSIMTEIQENPFFSVVDRSTLKDIIKEKELAMTGLVADSDIEVGKIAGADYILSAVIEQGVLEMKLLKVRDSVVQAYEFIQLSNDRNYNAIIPPDKIILHTGWISANAYQSYFDTRLKFGYYPVEIRGRKYNGTSQYYGVYKINVERLPWYTHHGISKNFFNKKNSEYTSQGFSLMNKTEFRDENGIQRYNAIWTKEK